MVCERQNEGKSAAEHRNRHQEELANFGHRCVATNSPVRNRSRHVIGTKSEPVRPVVTEFETNERINFPQAQPFKRHRSFVEVYYAKRESFRRCLVRQ